MERRVADFDASLVKRMKLLALTQLTNDYGKFPGNYDMPLGWPSLVEPGAADPVIEVRPIQLIASSTLQPNE